MDNRNRALSSQGPQPSPLQAQSKGFAVAEYASLGLSVAGAIAALLSQQAAYAAAPMSVSLLLNLLNRQRLKQQIVQQSQLAAQQTQQVERFGQRLEPMQLQMGELQAEVNAQSNAQDQLKHQFEQDLPELTAQLTGQLTQVRDITAAQIQDLKASLADCASNRQLELLQAEFSEQFTPLSEQVAEQRQRSQVQLDQFRAELSDQLAYLSEHLSEQLSEQQQASANQAEELHTLAKLFVAGRSQLDGLVARLAELEQIERDRPDLADRIDRLQRAIAGRLQVIQRLFTDLASQEETEQLQVELEQQTQRSRSLLAQINQIQTELNSHIQRQENHQKKLSLTSTRQVDELTQRLRQLEGQLKPNPPAQELGNCHVVPLQS